MVDTAQDTASHRTNRRAAAAVAVTLSSQDAWLTAARAPEARVMWVQCSAVRRLETRGEQEAGRVEEPLERQESVPLV